MAENKSKTGIPKKPGRKLPIEDLGVYVNLMTDFGFKRIFGEKETMLHFLNTILADDIKESIVDLHYENTERLGLSKYDRKAIYDLYCITENGARIIVEMQVISQQYFMERIAFYATRLIQEQSKKGKDWDFNLQPMYSINILNYYLDEKLVTDKYASYVQLIDRDTHRVFYDKLTLIFVELPRFTTELKQLKTFLEKWIFIIKRLHELNELPEELSEEVFEKLFETAKTSRMTRKDLYNYLKDLNNMNIVQNEIRALKNIISTMNSDLIEKDKNLAIKDNVIATMDKNLVTMDKNLATKDRIIAEYQRRFGVLNNDN
jgi:predicted transposase/invertase (TIGR01784 family)